MNDCHMLDCALVSHLNMPFQLPIVMAKRGMVLSVLYPNLLFFASLLGNPPVWVSRTVPIGAASSFDYLLYQPTG